MQSQKIKEIIQKFLNVRKVYTESFLDNNLKTIKRFKQEKFSFNQSSKEHSFQFNVLKFFDISETKHSQLLGHLLDPNGNHGQGNLFLGMFLETLGIQDPWDGCWAVTAEKGRIDILIKRKFPIEKHSVIIIENKSNNAPDQPSQLYRYWYQEIYKPNKTINPLGELQFYPENRYKIVYLIPRVGKVINEISIIRPNSEIFLNLPEKLPLNPITLTFSESICDLLCNAKNKIGKNNFRLQEYLSQYINFWH